jgi:hypothetical protein
MEEDESQAAVAAENGEASLLTENSSGQKMPPLGNRHGEHRLQKLPTPSPAPCRHEALYFLSLAAKAGQEKAAHLQITVEEIAALVARARSAELLIILPPQEQIKEAPHRPPRAAPRQQGGIARRHSFINGDACAQLLVRRRRTAVHAGDEKQPQDAPDLAGKIRSSTPTRHKGQTSTRPSPTINTTSCSASPPPLSDGKAAEEGFGPAWSRERRSQEL